MLSLADEKYVRLTTFTKDGRRKESPVWIAPLGDGRVGFTTQLDSWKVKRIRATPHVELAPSNLRGVVADGVADTGGTAAVVTGADAEPVRRAIRAKYGVQVLLAQLPGHLGRLIGRRAPESCGIVITLD